MENSWRSIAVVVDTGKVTLAALVGCDTGAMGEGIQLFRLMRIRNELQNFR